MSAPERENRREGADGVLITALARGATYKAAAETAGVSESTARRRMDDPAFRQQVAAVRTEMLGAAIGRLTDALAGSAATLAELATTASSESVRLYAARATLEMTIRLRESLEFSERLDRLEAAAAAKGRAA